ncbi:tetratricopeptide repeat protein [Halopseudomonas nanhaiensis]|uniref:tetratricopeptide repeat protein n=1 Tax=Halopseudomonas nanhaiensis TaxID=2830842 RepID=UPI001CC01019|nr:tetratricopeptide repeat protein [Halopseudomonas nanhaiensis]UAW97925.1 tetratricopeptide repeat protein [Halopseudomonas nanhaiensis]
MNQSLKAPLKLTLLAALLASLVGCAHLGSQAEPTAPAEPVVEAPAAPEEAEEIVYGQFTKDSLFALLTAEIAGQRNRFDVALVNYLDQARTTRDAGVIARAMQVAEFLGAHEQALEMALLWVEVAPNDSEALRAGALQLARAGEHSQAMQLMQRVLDLHGETNFDFLALAAAQTDAKTRQSMLQSLEGLRQQHPDNAQLTFSTALLLQQEGRKEEALKLLQALPDSAASQPTIMLQARLLADQGLTEKAIESLQEGLRNFPDDTRMRLLMARLLVAEDNMDAAATQFAALVQQNPDDAELLLTLGLVNLENDDPQAAIDYLQRAEQVSPGNSVARYHLGLAHQAAGDDEQAIEAWRSVGPGNEFLTSRLQLAQALAKQGRTEELGEIMTADRNVYPQHALPLYLLEVEALTAVDIRLAIQRIDEALQAFDGHSDLLYTRAMLHEQQGDHAAFESDLRTIIADDPDNAMALNALGYTLADRNERLDEALALIERAHAIDSDDPAIIDSLGWVHYRLGNLERAEAYLRQAYKAMPDQEVAAHLGEVLWQQGNRREAVKLWEEAAQRSDDDSLIRATRERLEQR